VDDQAQNRIIVVAGANGALTPADVRAAASTVSSADILLCQLEVPLETSLAAFRLAKAGNTRTILNPAPAAQLSQELLNLTDLLIPNQSEFQAIDGTFEKTADLGTLEAAARRFALKPLIVTLGEQGSLVLEGATVKHIPAPKIEPVDPTGAGDAFIGSLAVYWGQGLPLEEAARRASAVAALAVTRPGAWTAFPSCAEVDKFLSIVL
jgi:ribokinase